MLLTCLVPATLSCGDRLGVHGLLLWIATQVPPEQLDDPGILGQTQQRADHVL